MSNQYLHPGYLSSTCTGGLGFCNKNNVDQCISYLSQELQVLGFPCLHDPVSETFDIVQLVNCTHDLLNIQHKHGTLKEQMEDRQLRLEGEMSHLKSSHQSLKEKLDFCRREITNLRERERITDTKNKALTQKLKAETLELKRLSSVVSQRDVQYKHEVKKKEKECEKLKERLHQLISDKRQDQKIGLDILNSLHRSGGGGRTKWSTTYRQEEDMYRLLITNYEEKQKELMVENSDLRQCLLAMQRDLVALLNVQTSPVKTGPRTSQPVTDETDNDCESLSVTTATSVDELTDGHFEMPYELVREDIERDLKEKLSLLKDKIKKTEAKLKEKVLSENSLELSQASSVEKSTSPKKLQSKTFPVERLNYAKSPSYSRNS